MADTSSTTTTSDAAELNAEGLDDQLSYLVRLIQIGSYKRFEEVNQDCGTAPRFFGMLKLIKLNPGVSQNVLARSIFLDRSSLVPIIEKMGQEGLVEPRKSETDQRVKCLFLTEKGLEIVHDLEARAAFHEASLSTGLTELERQILVSLLQRVAKNLM